MSEEGLPIASPSAVAAALRFEFGLNAGGADFGRRPAVIVTFEGEASGVVVEVVEVVDVVEAVDVDAVVVGAFQVGDTASIPILFAHGGASNATLLGLMRCEMPPFPLLTLLTGERAGSSGSIFEARLARVKDRPKGLRGDSFCSDSSAFRGDVAVLGTASPGTGETGNCVDWRGLLTTRGEGGCWSCLSCPFSCPFSCTFSFVGDLKSFNLIDDAAFLSDKVRTPGNILLRHVATGGSGRDNLLSRAACLRSSERKALVCALAGWIGSPGNGIVFFFGIGRFRSAFSAQKLGDRHLVGGADESPIRMF